MKTLKIILFLIVLFLILNKKNKKKEKFSDNCNSCRIGYISGIKCIKKAAPLWKKFGQLSNFFDEGVRKYLCNKYGDKFENAYKNGINTNYKCPSKSTTTTPTTTAATTAATTVAKTQTTESSQFDGVKMNAGDGESAKEIEITNKINETKGTKEFTKACVKLARKEVYKGEKANGVTMDNAHTKCFAEFGMYSIKRSNEYITGYLREPAEIPNSAKSIDDFAFYRKKLTSVEIPKYVTSIGDSAFEFNKLTSVEIPNSVKSIGDNAFQYNKLTSVVIPNSVTSIDDKVFSKNKLTSVIIPNSVKSISARAFEKNKLPSVTIPNSVTSIGYAAFENNKLTSVVIPNSVTSIGGFAFSENKLTSVVIPNSVITISKYAFWDNKLTSVVIPNSVKSIGRNAFDKNVKIIYQPADLKSKTAATTATKAVKAVAKKQVNKTNQKYTDKKIIHNDFGDLPRVIFSNGETENWDNKGLEKQAGIYYKKEPTSKSCENLCSGINGCTGYFYTGTKPIGSYKFGSQKEIKKCNLFSIEYRPLRGIAGFSTSYVGEKYSTDEVLRFKTVAKKQVAKAKAEKAATTTATTAATTTATTGVDPSGNILTEINLNDLSVDKILKLKNEFQNYLLEKIEGGKWFEKDQFKSKIKLNGKWMHYGRKSIYSFAYYLGAKTRFIWANPDTNPGLFNIGSFSVGPAFYNDSVGFLDRDFAIKAFKDDKNDKFILKVYKHDQEPVMTVFYINKKNFVHKELDNLNKCECDLDYIKDNKLHYPWMRLRNSSNPACYIKGSIIDKDNKDKSAEIRKKVEELCGTNAYKKNHDKLYYIRCNNSPKMSENDKKICADEQEKTYSDYKFTR